jgi:hypothetical protein
MLIPEVYRTKVLPSLISGHTYEYMMVSRWNRSNITVCFFSRNKLANLKNLAMIRVQIYYQTSTKVTWVLRFRIHLFFAQPVWVWCLLFQGPTNGIMLYKKITFQTNKYALREETQNFSVKTGKNGLDTCFRNRFSFNAHICWCEFNDHICEFETMEHLWNQHNYMLML